MKLEDKFMLTGIGLLLLLIAIVFFFQNELIALGCWVLANIYFISAMTLRDIKEVIKESKNEHTK